ncbi:hypothetical protein KY495_22300 [Massilia sp. PAMC28688]|uniref:hypothetical protein n=1 Tax=Massilia sp. PAMC28688 TaxID=2861283 RepID=UPI001C638970|nr:hypothetical protein [Massilia sp. PAMC28688]QYF93368.1 hypothetical protein KY495_22300 [Massilia sp. PAMC28688]
MTEQTDYRLQQRLLLGRRVDKDRLVLADDVLRAALDGTRHLTAGERAALQASPLTLRRLRTLSQQRAASWQGSRGMLRVAAGNTPLDAIATDDGMWTLHFVPDQQSWRVIVALDAGAPFARELLRGGAVRVNDDAGNVVLEGQLDADGECEAGWPFDTEPALHFHQHGAGFSVEPVR